MQNKKIEIYIGLFMIFFLFSIFFLCLKFTDVNLIQKAVTYKLSAYFDDIGGLKIHSPVRIGGVIVGRVSDITLDSITYIPKVTMDIEKIYNNIPNTSSIEIRTLGLIGEQYLSLNIGFEDPNMGTLFLKDGDVIKDAKSPIMLDRFISQLLYKNSDNAK